ncbi:MAG: L-idonate 5-dehydrogenase [Bosea sp. (in: a-proteobacteria)]
MSDVAHAATLFGAGDLRFVPRELGPLPAGMLRIAFGAGGICGSDMHYFRHGRSGDFTLKSPLVLGHEIAGEIVAGEAEAHGLHIGQRVAINPSRWCGHCTACKAGRPNLCENIYFMGSASKTPHMQGGFSSLFDVVPAQCVPIPDHVFYAAAALAEPLAVCLHALARAGDVAGRNVLVVGAGPIGLLTLLAAKAAGAGAITITDMADMPLGLAAKLGTHAALNIARNPDALTSLGPVFDIVFEASGSPHGLASALNAAKRGGIVVQIGNQPAGDIPFPANMVMAKEIDLRGSFRFGQEFGQALAMIASGVIKVSALITAQLPLAQAKQAMGAALDRASAIKVVLIADGSTDHQGA